MDVPHFLKGKISLILLRTTALSIASLDIENIVIIFVLLLRELAYYLRYVVIISRNLFINSQNLVIIS